MRVLGVDPGTVSAGFAIVEGLGAFRGRWIEAGNVAATFAASAALLERLTPDLVVVEEPVWIGREALAKLGAQLLMTSWHGGGWLWLAKSMGIRAECVYAREWRNWLVNDVSPSDATIADGLKRVVSDIPKRTNNHERDAAGVAWSGLRLPPDWTEMRRLAAEMRAKAAGAKAAGSKRMKAAAKLAGGMR